MSNKEVRNSKIFMYVAITILIISIASSTYAIIQKVLFDDLTVNTVTKGLDYYINYTKGNSVSAATLTPSSDYTGGTSVSVQFYKKDNTYDIYGHIYLDVTTVGSGIGVDPGFKYTVVDSHNNIIEEDNIFAKNGFSIPLTGNIPLTTMQETYTVYIWIDENSISNYELEGETFSATVRCEATMKPIQYVRPGKVIDVITKRFTPNSTVINNSITYNIDTEHNLIKDTRDNIRYFGASPNNYIKFNCETYPNTNCETWRIIGVVDGKVKLMRNQQIGKFSWDTSASTVNSGYGINQWGESTYTTDGSTYSGADLMKLLNPGYEDNEDLNASGATITVNNSLYYNSGSGTCYRGQSNTSTTTGCNFTSAGVQGIKNDATRNKIAETTFYTGGWNSYSIYPNVILDKERGTTVISNPSDGITRTTTWLGRVAVPYPSDYGYAVDLSKCTGKNLGQYNDSNCTANNWMNNIITNNGSNVGWLLTPHSGIVNGAWIVYSSGDVRGGLTTSVAYGVAPVLYLSSNEIIESGGGSEGDPYTLAA